MGRKSTGTVRILKNDQGERQWHAKWTLADGSRTKWLPLDPSIGLDDVAGAKVIAARMSSDARSGTNGPSIASALDAWLDKRWRSVGRSQYEQESLAIRRYVYPVQCASHLFNQDTYEKIIGSILRDESIAIRTRRKHAQAVRKALVETGIYLSATINARDAIRHAAAQLGGVDALLDAIAGEFDIPGVET